MNLNTAIIVAIFAISSSFATPQAPNRFIVEVVTFTGDTTFNDTNSVFQCHATYFRERHVLTAASCVTHRRDSDRIGVIARAIYNATTTVTQYSE